jgi:thioredoxin 1
MLELTLENFEEEILNSVNPCMVTFKNESCHLCRGLTVVLGSLVRKYDGRAKFATVDSFEQDELTKLFGVDGVPTIFLFVDGDAREIPYPEVPSHLSGYSEKYLISFLDVATSDE